MSENQTLQTLVINPTAARDGKRHIITGRYYGRAHMPEIEIRLGKTGRFRCPDAIGVASWLVSWLGAMPVEVTVTDGTDTATVTVTAVDDAR